jgi:GntR family carbon starvation induced transcriptional regulator
MRNMTKKINVVSTPTITRAHEAYQRLRADILKGVLIPGQKLKFEVLQEELGYSASPLREALTRLTADGFVTSEQRRGFSVAMLSMEELEDITRLRCLLEPLALKDSIEHGDDAWEANLLAAYHRLSKIEQNTGEDPGVPDNDWAHWHRNFHDSLVAACPSKKLLHFRSLLFEQSERYRFLSSAQRTRKRNKTREHKNIMHAALARDVTTAAKLITDHISLTVEHLNKVLE